MTESFSLRVRQIATRTGALAAVLVLAACASGADDTPADAPKSADTAAAATTPTTGASAGLANCSTPSAGKVHFTVAKAGLAVPGAIVLDAIPAGMQPPITKERVVAQLKAQTSQGQGCPGTPLAAGLILLKDDLKHPLLDGNMGLLALPPGGITERFAAETRRLQKDPPKTCSPVGVDLIGCVGVEKRGGTETNVLYVITTDPNQNMASGGPLAARCVLKGEQVEGCNLVDQLAGGVAIDASLKSGTYSTAGLRGALDAAVARVDAMRL